MGGKITYANVVATLALFLAVSTGGAWAANKLISGQKIKPHTITGKQVKKRSLPLAVLRGKLPAGPKGPTGSVGVPGTTGATGITGIAGEKGAKGAKGVTGPAGPTGLTGNVGVSGNTGEIGPTGDTGPTGVTGADAVSLFAAVNANGTYNASSSKGVLSVSSDQAGIYVVTFDRESLSGCVANVTAAQGGILATIGGATFPLNNSYVFVYTQTITGAQLLQSSKFYLTVTC